MHHFWLFLKGIAMGSADVVPGVSGGTIAFVTGIYDQLLGSIRKVDAEAVRLLFKQGPKAAWLHINGTFLVILGAGVLTALLSLAKGIHYLLVHYPVWLWAFFFGLIIASVVHVGREIRQWNAPTLLLLAAGAVVAGWISMAAPTSIEATPLVVFLAGSIAICAMILPGISGSFILLLMGLYEPILGALKSFDLGIMALFGAGAVIGLLSFSRFLSWLLAGWREATFAILTGFMIGSLVKVWPWKETLTTRLNSKGETVPVYQQNILPDIGTDLLLALLLMVAGLATVLLLEWVAKRQGDAD
ncbi:DUF368 domain-containing protein [Oceanobacter sp. 5_MG-2023]|uniref:DUF368 domain-containing protein n=1 Tax=Oceanobacter sp. 5_MG-2023 TaxID=3062645 RepID=UPI0026E1E32A|nr:DUF368 domain-containing protein [Oceanobacter sp. 5_MG-2023]MDO6681666.1 DUF368 domain-containing protein [Oceanobacter sp. 5_MG-2023]